MPSPRSARPGRRPDRRGAARRVPARGAARRAAPTPARRRRRRSGAGGGRAPRARRRPGRRVPGNPPGASPPRARAPRGRDRRRPGCLAGRPAGAPARCRAPTARSPPAHPGGPAVSSGVPVARQAAARARAMTASPPGSRTITGLRRRSAACTTCSPASATSCAAAPTTSAPRAASAQRSSAIGAGGRHDPERAPLPGNHRPGPGHAGREGAAGRRDQAGARRRHRPLVGVQPVKPADQRGLGGTGDEREGELPGQPVLCACEPRERLTVPAGQVPAAQMPEDAGRPGGEPRDGVAWSGGDRPGEPGRRRARPATTAATGWPC